MNRRLFGIGKLAALIACAFVHSACSSTDGKRFGSEPEPPETLLPAGAYGGDGMTFNKWQPSRAPEAHDFFYKRCHTNDRKAYWSKTSYDCTVP